MTGRCWGAEQSKIDGTSPRFFRPPRPQDPTPNSDSDAARFDRPTFLVRASGAWKVIISERDRFERIRYISIHKLVASIHHQERKGRTGKFSGEMEKKALARGVEQLASRAARVIYIQDECES